MLAWMLVIAVLAMIIGLIAACYFIRRANRPTPIAEHTDAYWRRARGGRA
jgi:hypothetical protein